MPDARWAWFGTPCDGTIRWSAGSTGCRRHRVPSPATPERLALLSGLAGVATWEYAVPSRCALALALRRSRTQSPRRWSLPVPPGPLGRSVPLEDLGDVLLGPIVETVRAGVVWDNYELIQEMEDSGGVVHRILVRATLLSEGDGAGFFGIMADVSDPGRCVGHGRRR